MLRQQAANGEMVLAYCDEAGFSQVHPNRSAWTPVGERHLIEAKRGTRLNVLAAMLSTGELFSAKIWQSTTAEIFTGFVGLLKEHVGKKLTVIIDNASIHKAKATRHLMDILEKQGVTLYFLPPYSPPGFDSSGTPATPIPNEINDLNHRNLIFVMARNAIFLHF